MSRVLLINVAELLRRPGSDRDVHVKLTVDELGVVDERFTADDPVRIVLRLESLTDGIVVDGTLSARWHATCRRCLEPAGAELICEVHELYQLVLTDPEAFLIVGDQIDLRPMVAETLLLDAPLAPLCRPDCAGLCPSCGARLDVDRCECAPAPVSGPFAALEALRNTADGDLG